jgi:hypothetical protein
LIKTFTHQLVDVPKLVLEEDDKGRKYVTPGGKKYPSVTTVLGELPNKALAAWKKRVGKDQAAKISKAATNRGSALHKQIEFYLRNEKLDMSNDPFTASLFGKVQSTLNGIDYIKIIESSLYSDRLRMAGTPDCIAEYGGKLSVIDFKTSTDLKKVDWINGYFSQASAYAIMYEEHFVVRPEQCVIIIAVENANIPQVFVKSIDESFQMLKEYVGKLIEYRKGIST